MKMAFLAAVTLWAAFPVEALAQDEGLSEVIVTARRREADDYSAEQPAIGLRRTADFAVQEVTISGDTRAPDQRADEIYAMLANAIAAAPKSGVQLAFGERTVQAVTLKNFRDLSLVRDSRPDSQKLTFLVKIPLGGTDAAGAQSRINSFVKTVKPVGRALMETSEDLTLSIVAPDQYRGAVADAIATDAKTMAAKLGDGYGVEIEGLNRPVEWVRAGLSEVLLYIPYKLVVVPKH
jgi:hypothetical protein